MSFKVIPFNCIAHPYCASFFAWLARAPARARSELDRFSMEAELFREINGRFLPNELGDPTFLFHFSKENTTLHDIFKFEEFFIIQFWNIPVDSLLQSDFRRYTVPCRRSICLLFQSSLVVTAILRRFTVTLFFCHKNNAYISLLVITLLK